MILERFPSASFEAFDRRVTNHFNASWPLEKIGYPSVVTIKMRQIKLLCQHRIGPQQIRGIFTAMCCLYHLQPQSI